MDSQFDGSYINMLLNGSQEILDNFNETPIVEEVEKPVEISTTRKAQRSKNFTRQEDILLVAGWLRTSKDAITGTDQQNGCFWGRIHNFFTSHGGGQGRSQTSLSSRFADINKHCAKFSGFYSQIERRSGETQENRMDDARQMYFSIMKKQFQYEHCWEVLKNEAKWSTSLSQKKQKSNSDASPGVSSPATQSINLGDDDSSIHVRPMGIKASKKKAKGKKCVEVDEEIASARVLDQYRMERMEIERAKAERHDKAIAQQAEALAQHTESLAQHAKSLELKERIRKERILKIDTSAMDPVTKNHYSNLKMEILTKRGFNM